MDYFPFHWPSLHIFYKIDTLAILFQKIVRYYLRVFFNERIAANLYSILPLCHDFSLACVICVKSFDPSAEMDSLIYFNSNDFSQTPTKNFILKIPDYTIRIFDKIIR